MSSMAFSMHLFTRGEGPLKTTQDLFVQAEYFSEEGYKLYKSVREFTSPVPTWQFWLVPVKGDNSIYSQTPIKQSLVLIGNLLRGHLSYKAIL
jgi:hypothetical protein